MKKILFLIHDLGPGGAEKVLVNLVNNMDREKFDITVMTLFDVGVNKQFLKPHIKYKYCFKHMFSGNSHVMKLFSPKMLHKWFIKDHYDIEVSYLEGPSARVISGCQSCDTKLVSWIHVEQHTTKIASQAFRNYDESAKCYARFHQTVCVSEFVKNDFSEIYPTINKISVLYNTNETQQIIEQSKDILEDNMFFDGRINICGVGKLMKNKGFDRLLRVHKRLRVDNYPVHTYILGEGSERPKLEAFINENSLSDSVTLLGYKTNPYKYVAKCDIFACTSYSEGFSTAATEALIVGTPVVTTMVSGMKEMLGENDEYGIVTENNEDALYEGIKSLLDNPELLALYKEKSSERGKSFSTEATVKSVEDMLMNL